jgi:hypothetical protein
MEARMRNRNKFATTLVIVVLCLILAVSTGAGSSSAAPAPQTTQESSPVVMIALPWDDPTIRIPPPQPFRARRAPTATFLINYLAAGTPDGKGATCLAWNTSAQAAFTYAANVWATLISSPVPIKIDACWANLGSPSILGYSGSSMLRNFTGAPVGNTWYNYALGDALAGTDLVPGSPDNSITYNSGFSWYFGTDGQTPPGYYDFVSVVMHEMGHGLNFSGTMSYGTTYCGGTTNGCWGRGTGYPGIYDRFTETAGGDPLLNTSLFPSPSTQLGAQLTSNDVYFDGPYARAANGGTPVKIYAPYTWTSGSSYSHLDFDTFKSTANRLMVYAINSASSIHDPGPVAMGLLRDLGWNPSAGNPVPSISSLNPSWAAVGGPAFTLTVNGANFINGSVVRWNGADRTTTYLSGTQLTAAIAAADITSPSTANVTVFNPAPGGGTSNAMPFSIGAVPKLYLPLIAKAPSWMTLVSTDFEGPWPGPWVVFDNNGAHGGEYYWGPRNCRAYSGSNSGWAIGAGAHGSATGCGANYPDYADSWMVYGPFSLADANAADLKFKLWLNSEPSNQFYDGVCRMAATYGSYFYGTCTWGYSDGWIDRVLDLSNVPTLGNLLGQPKVWIAIKFFSDYIYNYAEGAHVDDIVLRKCPLGASCPPGVSPVLPATGRIVETPVQMELRR